MSRIGAYWLDLKTLPGDALLAYRHEGWTGAWKAVATRSLHRIFRRGRLMVFAHQVDQMVDLPPPAGVRITQPTAAEWARLASLVGRRELQRFRALSARGRRCLVAWRGETPVGYAWVADDLGPDVAVSPLPLAFPSSAAYLLNLYVLPSERSSGIGSALASGRLRLARESGFREGWRMVAPTNAPSLRTVQKTAAGTRLVGDPFRPVARPHLRPVHPQRPGDPLTTSNLPLTGSGERAAKPAQRRVLRRIMGYALFRGTAEVMLAIRGVLLAVLLGPAAFGTWALLRLVMRYSSLVG